MYVYEYIVPTSITRFVYKQITNQIVSKLNLLRSQKYEIYEESFAQFAIVQLRA